MESDLRRWMKLVEDAVDIDVSETVTVLRDEFTRHYGGIDAAEINRGLCLDFARALVQRLGDGATVETSEAHGLTDKGWHAWVKYDDRNYDAQHPNGVRNPASLSVFKPPRRRRG